MKYVVISNATVQRTYWVEADDKKSAEELTCNMSPGDEEDIIEETLSIVIDGDES